MRDFAILGFVGSFPLYMIGKFITDQATGKRVGIECFAADIEGAKAAILFTDEYLAKLSHNLDLKKDGWQGMRVDDPKKLVQWLQSSSAITHVVFDPNDATTVGRVPIPKAQAIAAFQRCTLPAPIAGSTRAAPPTVANPQPASANVPAAGAPLPG